MTLDCRSAGSSLASGEFPSIYPKLLDGTLGTIPKELHLPAIPLHSPFGDSDKENETSFEVRAVLLPVCFWCQSKVRTSDRQIMGAFSRWSTVASNGHTVCRYMSFCHWCALFRIRSSQRCPKQIRSQLFASCLMINSNPNQQQDRWALPHLRRKSDPFSLESCLPFSFGSSVVTLCYKISYFTYLGSQEITEVLK